MKSVSLFSNSDWVFKGLITHHWRGLAAAAVASVFLSACGNGGGASTAAGTDSGSGTGGAGGTPVANLAPPTPQSAARLMSQASYGATKVDIDRIQALGWDAWLTEQFNTPSIDTHLGYVNRGGPPNCNPCDSKYINAVMESFWRQVVLSPDVLRQRAVFALSQIFVVSTVNSAVDIQADAHAAYLDMLARNAFGNYRQLLEEVSLHPTMGIYLSHLRNQKEDAATGRIPDQNYAREVMQLFSIGLWQLNPDGSRKKDAMGNDIPTYEQADISGMSRVFTGWSWGNQATTDDNFRWGDSGTWHIPMQGYPGFHSSSEKRIINGVVIPANTAAPASLKIALDTLFNHPNVGPFIGSQLIKRLVTSNPSPAYISRVSAVFADNGSGVRGDMKAVWRAVLLDPDARDASKISQPTWGKLREPILRYAHFLRSFNVKSDSTKYTIWNLEELSASLGQNPMRAPSVFNWYRPDYAPQGPLRRGGLKAPEFQIAHETTVTGYTNFMLNTVQVATDSFKNDSRQYGPVNDFMATDYAAERALAGNATALVDHLNLILMSGQMSASLRSKIIPAINAVPSNSDRNLYQRVATAVGLIMVSPEYLIQK
jgi:uncharacterized protein (DUF1800 family)